MSKLTPRDMEVLVELEAANRSLSKYGREWATPLDCGGSNGSDHSYRLTKLAHLGLAQSKQRSGETPPDWTNGKKRWAGRGSKCYRITDAGRAALANREGKNDLRKAVAAAIFDPGATEGLKGSRTLTEWQTDAVMRALARPTERKGDMG